MLFSRNAAIAQKVGGLLLIACTGVSAQEFADDFSTNSFDRNYRLYTDAIANVDSAATVDDNGLLLNIIHEEPSGDKRAVYEFNNNSTTDSISMTAQYLDARPAVGNLRIEASASFFNSIADGGVNPGEREGDVEVEIVLRLGTTQEEDRAEVCFKLRDAEGNSQPLEPTRNKCESFQQAGLNTDTAYPISIGVNRETMELYGSLGDETITAAFPFQIFDVADPFAFARVRVRDGAESGSFRISALSFDAEPVDLAAVDTTGRYRSDDFDDFTGDNTRSKEIVDERLRLSATVNNAEDEQVSFLRLARHSGYLEADMQYSSESDVQTSGGGFAAVRIAGIIYNDLSADGDNLNGSVWTSVMLIKNADSQLVGEYCIIRSNDENFSTSTDLADGLDDDRCPTFDLEVSEDTTYNASIALDEAAKTLTFKLGEEVKVYNITTDIYTREDDTMRAQARMAQGATGTVVGYFDNLRNDPNARTDEEIAAAMNQDSEGSSSGGGGCSVANGQQEYSMLLLMLLALVTQVFRKVSNRRQQ
jgi:hypothetical protein